MILKIVLALNIVFLELCMGVYFAKRKEKKKVQKYINSQTKKI